MSARDGMQRSVNASPTIRVYSPFSGTSPARNVLRSPRAISWVVSVAVDTTSSAARVLAGIGGWVVIGYPALRSRYTSVPTRPRPFLSTVAPPCSAGGLGQAWAVFGRVGHDVPDRRCEVTQGGELVHAAGVHLVQPVGHDVGVGLDLRRGDGRDLGPAVEHRGRQVAEVDRLAGLRLLEGLRDREQRAAELPVGRGRRDRGGQVAGTRGRPGRGIAGGSGFGRG